MSVKMESVKSKQIKKIGWENTNMTLYIEFHRSNNTYMYYNVPEEIYNGIKTADSPGKYFQKNIRDIYSYNKVQK